MQRVLRSACVTICLLSCLVIASNGAQDGAAGDVPVPHPSVLGVGVPKSGTTSLYNKLIKIFPEEFNVPVEKEVNMLVRKALLDSESGQKEYYARLNASGPNRHTIDFTPSYYWSMNAVHNAKKLLPQGTKALVMLRDPVTMLVSYLKWRKGHAVLHKLNASEVLLEELRVLNSPNISRRLHAAVSELSPQEGMREYLSISREVDKRLADKFGAVLSNKGQDCQGFILPALYLPGMRYWDAEFFTLSGEVLVVLSDDYYHDTAKALKTAIVPFLFGDDKNPDPKLWAKYAASPYSAAKRLKEVQPSLHCQLVAFFKPFNCQLAQLLRKSKMYITTYPAMRLGPRRGCDLWPRAKSPYRMRDCVDGAQKSAHKFGDTE